MATPQMVTVDGNEAAASVAYPANPYGVVREGQVQPLALRLETAR